ncbi:MAG: glycerophosphodiester phosphodiesterase family protein [Acidobacteriota bacterium]|nr:glycerophosphodiester phosphodiesterase family protein [Acidobacteriota bacterium]
MQRAIVSYTVLALASSILPMSIRAAEPIVIAHRGASGYLPEHTLEAYALAHGMDADFIEPDLVRTRDGAFICLHDIYLEATTDVEEVFPDRGRDDGRWYAADFDLAEIRMLRAHERLPGRFPQQAEARFAVPTFEEMIELVQALNRSTSREAGIYPELKAPSFHREAGLGMEAPFLELVRHYGYIDAESPIFVQSFEPGALEELRRLGSSLRQVFLIGGQVAVDESALQAYSSFADGIGPSKHLLFRDPEIVRRAHAAGLLVHSYTLRADDIPEAFTTFDEELEELFGVLAVDGAFTDFPDRARTWLSERSASH